MKLLRSFIQSRYPWAVAAGLMLAAAFPNFNIAGSAWVAPGLLLLAAIGTSGKQAFRIGYIGGLAHYLASLSWLLLIPVTGYPILGWAALGAFLALLPALWVWLVWKLFPAKLNGEGPAGYVENLGGQFLSVPWSLRLAWALGGAAVWVALEMAISRFLGGFPWNLLGSSQYRLPPLIQIASVTGIYGVSFVLVWASLSLVCAGMVIIRRPAKSSAWVGEIILPMMAVAALFSSGYWKLLQPAGKTPGLTVAFIQPGIPQSLIWEPAEDSNRFTQLLQLSKQALKEKPDLLLWPEGALPKRLRYHEDMSQPVESLASNHHAWIILGSDDMEPGKTATGPDAVDYFNCAFLISPEGRIVDRYVKRHLVIFGEYIPLVKWLPFLKYFTPIGVDGFSSGEKVEPFALRDLKVNVSVLICFEDVFPHLVREYVSDDTDFLINLTNDGWFGEGAAQWQHAAGAVFRAVENGVPLARCSNNGLTCWIDAQGRVAQYFTNQPGGIYGQGFMIARIPVLAPGETRPATFYRRHGDAFGWGCVAYAVLQVARFWFGKRKTE